VRGGEHHVLVDQSAATPANVGSFCVEQRDERDVRVRAVINLPVVDGMCWGRRSGEAEYQCYSSSLELSEHG